MRKVLTDLMKTAFCALLTIFALSCNKDGADLKPRSIKLDGTAEVVVVPNGSDKIEFIVDPPHALFNYDVDSPECQVSLTRSTNANTLYCKLSDISLVSAERGKYAATITDLGKSKSYEETVVLHLDEMQSEPFKVRIESGQIFSSIKFRQEDNKNAINQDYTVSIASGSATLKSPLIGSSKLVASFDSKGAKVYVNGVEQVSGETVNDYSKPVTFTVKSKIEYSFTVQVIHSGLPMVFIETNSTKDIPSKWEDWMKGAEIKIYNPDWTVDYEGPTSIRGRGNTTWGYPKKPYALKLDSKGKILGMPKHKRWVLLANWMDRTLLRNGASFELASRSGLAYTPRGQFVEVFINGAHKGNYFLCEHIKVDENRVNIDELDEDETDGGYIMELDAYYDEVYKFKSPKRNLPYMFKDPDEVNDAQFNFIKDYVSNLENALYDNSRFAAGEYMDYIDTESFADWWIVMELTGIWEPNHPKSTYMHKDKGGKLTMGPVWDFDWETYMISPWFKIKDALYYKRLFEDQRFVTLVKERWTALKPAFETLPAYIRSEAEKIRTSESFNHELWPIDIVVNQDESLTFDAAVSRMIEGYETKFNWLDKEINRL